MFCPSCGTKNNYYHRYCFHCGARLISEASETGPEQPEVREPDRKDREPQPEETIHIPQPQREEEDQTRNDSSPQQDEPEAVPLPEETQQKNEPGRPVTIPEPGPDEEEFEIGSRIPLRRYHDKAEGNGLQVLVKVCISVVLIALIAFSCYVGYDQWVKGRGKTDPVAKRIDFTYHVEEATAEDGTPARKIVILTSTGEQVRFSDRTFPVKEGKSEILLPDSEFELQEYEKKDDALQVVLDVLVKADGYPDREEKIEFEVPVSTAPLTILSPSAGEAVVDGNRYQLILEVQPGSQVFIDDNNYSHLVDDQGRLTVPLEVPEQPETRYKIRVSTGGYEDTTEEILLKKRQMEFPLTVDQSVPIRANEEEWVEITGNTHPEAVLTTNLEMKEQPVMDPATGDFKLHVKASAKGYTPFILTAALEGKEDSVLELVIEQPTEEREYTGSAWAADYEEMKDYPNLHNGTSFAFTGILTDIRSTGTKSVLLVNIAADGQPEQIICVEYWGSFPFSMGQKIRIFGNHWGSRDGVPLILAPYLYR